MGWFDAAGATSPWARRIESVGLPAHLPSKREVFLMGWWKIADA